MALTDKSKEMLKRFLTFNFEKDYDNADAKTKFADMFRKMLLSDDPGMKDVVKAMFNSFNKYNTDHKVLSNDEETPEEPVEAPEEQQPEEVPQEEQPQEQEPSEEEPEPSEEQPEEDEDETGGIFGEEYGFTPYMLESINDWLGE